jgi:GNAT superfamily N-acetyltransferase
MHLTFRQALKKDLIELIKLLADDKLGKSREDISVPINKDYLLSFEKIDKDPNNELIIVEENQKIIGMLQLTFVPYLTHIGSIRCIIEGVRINKQYRGKGLGTKTFQWAIQYAKKKDCNIVQLTSNKQRKNAIKFYQNLGFEATHEGLKLNINTAI